LFNRFANFETHRRIRFCDLLSNETALHTRCESAGRGGFTLLELMLVMAVIVTVLSLSIPAINRTFTRQALDKSGDRVRAAMGDARVQAIKEGNVYAVYIEKDGRWFDVAPFSSAKQQIEKSRNVAGDSSQRSDSDYLDNMLPNGIKFLGGETALNSRALSAASGMQTLDNNLLQILFYPDGTSQDARLALQNEHGSVVEVQLRGLTGIANVVRLKEKRR
jgi:prepilin-type N-terminal cleavage/methylation domain-containing protein